MDMSTKTSSRFLISVIALLCSAVFAEAQEAYGGYSPYSIVGIGDLSTPGSAYNKTMGGVGIATRNRRYLNMLNPASVTARDSLSFMADFSLSNKNTYFRQDGMLSANNIFNMGDFAISFPIQRRSAMMLGINSYSNTGFDYLIPYDDVYINSLGGASTQASGIGGVYKIFAAAGVTFFNRLSLGAQVDYYFGSIEKEYRTSFSDSAYRSMVSTDNLEISGVGGTFGLQYEQPIGRLVLGLGATYSTGAKLKGYYDATRYSSSSTTADTLYYKADTIGLTRNARIAGEIGVGLSLKRNNKWMVEVNYTRADWTGSGIEGLSGYNASTNPFTSTLCEAYRVGFEYIPNITDIRYYMKRVAYRAGAYYKTDYYTMNGALVPSVGVTFGMTLPIYRWYNGLSVGVEIGQRGSLSNNILRERYINFSIGINIFDIWFQKTLYD